MKRSTALIACMVAATALVPLSGAAQDLAQTAGKNIKVLLDNEKVRVLELQMPPGGKTGMHSHGDNIVYFITGGKATQTSADGTTKEMERKAGEAMWSGPVTHDTQNTGTEPVKTLIIELKESANAP
jgi:quercetin dioxygenase-like cupin family protein